MFTLSLPKRLFWDISPEYLDEVKSRRIIIERVLTRGDVPELKVIITFYGLEVIKKEIVKVAYLDKKTLAWVSLFLNIPKSKFKCYITKQSKKIHWDS